MISGRDRCCHPRSRHWTVSSSMARSTVSVPQSIDVGDRLGTGFDQPGELVGRRCDGAITAFDGEGPQGCAVDSSVVEGDEALATVFPKDPQLSTQPVDEGDTPRLRSPLQFAFAARARPNVWHACRRG